MDLVFDANNLVPDFVTVIAAEQCNRVTALPGWAGFSCCIHRPLLMDTAYVEEEGLLLRETILGGSRGISISSTGTARHEWVPALVLPWLCPSVGLCSRVQLTDGPPFRAAWAVFTSLLGEGEQKWILLGQDPLHWRIKEHEKSTAL